MRALFISSALLFAVGLATGCNSNAIGRTCVNPTGTVVAGTQISSPALECPSRLCLLQPPGASSGTNNADLGDTTARATCTATCGNNGDCEAETKDSCSSGFVCAIATQAGPFCCRKICICKDDLVEGVNKDTEGNVITPFSCTYDPTLNPEPSCGNVKRK